MADPRWQNGRWIREPAVVSDNRLAGMIATLLEPVIQRDRIEGDTLSALRELQRRRTEKP